MSNSFDCLTGVSKQKKTLAGKAGVKKRRTNSGYKVAAVRPATRISGASSALAAGKPAIRPVKKVRPVKKAGSAKKARRTVRKVRKKSRVKRRVVRKTRSLRRSKRKGKLRTIGRRLDARSVRKLAKRRGGSLKKSRRASSKRGWRTRSRGLGYGVANRGVSTSCFPARLKKLLRRVSNHYGRRLVITSGYRSSRHNRRIGGARRSQHIHCTAADFYVPGVNKYALARFLKRLPGRGGVGTYSGNRIVHLDVGPRRAWHWGGRKKRRFAKKSRSKRYRRTIRRNTRRVVKKRTIRKRYVAKRSVRFRGAKI